MSLELTVGDDPTLTGTINATTIGASGEVHVKRSDGTVVSRSATLTDNGDGSSAWAIDLTTADLTVAGAYYIEVQVTFSNGKIQTFARDLTSRQAIFGVRRQIA